VKRGKASGTHFLNQLQAVESVYFQALLL
jgi:hypothetical protein